MKTKFAVDMERMLAAIRDGNSADAFIFTRIVARFIYSKRPNLRMPEGWEC
jgi:hypothetical protein